MPYEARVIKVMIASPGDVSTERQIVRDVLLEWNYMHSEDRGLVLMPIGWETHSTPAMGDRPQAIINKQVLADCDLLVAVFWTRIGSPTGNAVSGTVEEIEEHLRAGKPVMLYFSSAPVRLDSVEEKQYAVLKQFKDECYKRGLVESYESISEFRDKFQRQLSLTVNRSYSASIGGFTGTIGGDEGDVPPQKPTIPPLGDAAKALLVEASLDPNGTIMKIGTMLGLAIQTNGKNLVPDKDARSKARWEGAIQELEKYGLIQARGYKREIFNVTDEGYRVVDVLRGAG